MSFDSVAVKILLTLSAILGVKTAPNPLGSGWTVDQPWVERASHMQMISSSNAVVDECKRMPSGRIFFPMIIQGVQTLTLDGQVILQTGDPTFQSTGSFYRAPVLECERIRAGAKLTWKIDSFLSYFARFDQFPHPSLSFSPHNIFAETAHALGAGGALTLAVFLLIIFLGKVRLPLAISVSLSCAGASVYFASCVSPELGFQWPMLVAHKVADLGVWCAIFSLINAFRLEGLVPLSYFIFYSLNVAVGCAIIALGPTGDVIQLGTSLPFASIIPLLSILLWRILRNKDGGWTRARALYALTLVSFIGVCFNEMIVVIGVASTAPMLPIGFLFGLSFFAFGVNERIGEAYRERDFLRTNLEGEVKRKTFELQTAMATLQSTQAELVQSAKLASLGTLSAGIAHEINNSLNYVNGAMQPLERIVAKSAREEDRPKIDKLLTVMKEGLHLTLEIIKSLRNHSGLNQAKFNDVSLREAAASSLAILRGRTRGKIEVDLQVPDSLMAFGSVVGLNQVFMNLISNAVDATPDGGRLTIEGEERGGEWAEVRVRDTGSGIAPETLARIFEPFFTTKGVGQGTGLGLHIVRGEIEKHGGSIEVQSEVGKGACFTIRLPIRNEKLAAQEVAVAAMPARGAA